MGCAGVFPAPPNPPAFFFSFSGRFDPKGLGGGAGGGRGGGGGGQRAVATHLDGLRSLGILWLRRLWLDDGDLNWPVGRCGRRAVDNTAQAVDGCRTKCNVVGAASGAAW